MLVEVRLSYVLTFPINAMAKVQCQLQLLLSWSHNCQVIELLNNHIKYDLIKYDFLIKHTELRHSQFWRSFSLYLYFHTVSLSYLAISRSVLV